MWLLLLACGGEPPAPTAATPPPPAPAVEPADTRGQDLLQQGDLPGALAAFDEALRQDRSDAQAHYGLASTLALLRRAGRICPYDAYEQRILDHLERAVQLDPDLRQRMAEDPNLAELRDTVRYRLLHGGSMASSQGLRDLLTGVELFGPAQGVWGAVSRIQLEEGGSVAVFRRVLQADGTIGDWAEDDGRWSVRDGTVRLELDDDVQELKLSSDGQLRAGDTTLWFDHPHDCSA